MSDTATKTFEAKISKLGDDIAGLTLKEAVDLADYMKQTYGIEPAAGGAVVMAGGAGGGGGAAENNQLLAAEASGARSARREAGFEARELRARMSRATGGSRCRFASCV